MTWLVPLWRSRAVSPELQRLADEEAAARLAVDIAMTRPTDQGEMVRLRERWSEANDRLADAIAARDAQRE